jgi:hypothetical protein
MARFIREFLLIPVPFGIVSVFFFLGHVPGMGVLFAVITAATLFYIRPRRVGPPTAAELVALDDLPEGPPSIGSSGATPK